MKNLSEIWNCPDSLEFQCPQTWGVLNTTNDNNVRYCHVCRQNVYMCLTPQEFMHNAKSGKCVAIPYEFARRPNEPELVVGRPSQETAARIKKQKKLVSQFIDWWKRVLTSEPLFSQRFMHKCYGESYLKNQEKRFALEILEFEQFGKVLEIARSNRNSEGFLTKIVKKLVSMGQLDVALEVAAIFEVSNYKVISLNHIASELARLGQLERAANIFEMSLQTAHNLTRASEKYETEVLRLAALVGITLQPDEVYRKDAGKKNNSHCSS
jgi:hypothetical protein